MNVPCYIRCSDQDKFFEILEILFKKGHVFSSTYRVNTMAGFHENWEQHWWNYIGIGCAHECKARLVVSDYNPPNGVMIITSEEFIEGNKA